MISQSSWRTSIPCLSIQWAAILFYFHQVLSGVWWLLTLNNWGLFKHYKMYLISFQTHLVVQEIEFCFNLHSFHSFALNISTSYRWCWWIDFLCNWFYMNMYCLSIMSVTIDRWTFPPIPLDNCRIAVVQRLKIKVNTNTGYTLHLHDAINITMYCKIE